MAIFTITMGSGNYLGRASALGIMLFYRVWN